MAAREDELESLVGDLDSSTSSSIASGASSSLAAHAVAPNPVDRAVARRGGEPSARIGGRSVAASARRRSRTPPARPPRRARSRRGSRSGWRGRDPLLPEGLLEQIYHSVIGRTSTAPPMRAAGTRAASAIAASRSSASNSRYPSDSFTATNGPSVVSVLPSSTRTVVAVSGGSSCRPGLTPGVSLMAW